MNRLELCVPPVAVTGLSALAMWSVAQLAPGLGLPIPARGPFALALAIAGAAIAAAGVAAFRSAHTTVNPTTPDASAAVVDSGIYARSRNPMYVAFGLMLAGWAAYLGNGLSLALLPAFVLYLSRFQIAPEERALTAKFGERYLDYTRRVRRWL
ncbi:MAG: isoprenylcysteine carboxylmethyltransferase family protein [Deltaproteobacteria bacterium]|nr:isoprenylcysteine carboxylmethyltransferase family protein [Deltaproteobacteria bacterium]